MKIVQIKNRPVRALVSFVSILAMIAAVAALTYLIGVISPIAGWLSYGEPDTAGIFGGGFLLLCGLTLFVLISWAVSECHWF
ncbi:MAG: hypothetical protein COV69_00385 [Parcubacteria group bacterium CG11_big_fil_rev_8_21_14_0_20_39_14]|nr:MAG: hypothetical protein COV69_00385 [Parcubacteria group bacterium CG11_big_fil_rev_8_21_14_0_20_39_14]PIS35067.1 MAG: hypothetical protein COT36_04395 [Parcubacteria group bacterium CG08_land_8_20_14_0_20_38_56]